MHRHTCTDLGPAMEAALGIERRLAELRTQLVNHPDPGGAAEAEIALLLGEREPLIREIGLVALRHALAGGRIELAPAAATPISEPEAPPAEEPERPDDVSEEVAVPEAPPPPEPEPPKPEPEPTTKGPPASMEDLMRLAGGLGPKWEGRPRQDAAAKLQPLIAALDRIGRPVEIESSSLYSQQVLHVRAAAEDLDSWRALDLEAQRDLLALAVAKARYLQDEVDGAYAREADRDGLARTFKAFTRFSADAKPGFVYGLTRRHSPTPEATWLGSTWHWWHRLAARAGLDGAAGDSPEPAEPEVLLARLQRSLARGPRPETITRAFLRAVEGGVAHDDPRLVRLAADHAEHLASEPALKNLRRSLRDAEGASEGDADEPAVDPIPEDWPWRAATSDRLAVIVGGDSRPEVAERVRRGFGFAEVEWDNDAQGRKLDNIAARIRNGTVGMVIFLARYGTHRAQKVLLDACKDGGVPFVRIDGGYGVDGIRREIEASVAVP